MNAPIVTFPTSNTKSPATFPTKNEVPSTITVAVSPGSPKNVNTF